MYVFFILKKSNKVISKKVRIGQTANTSMSLTRFVTNKSRFSMSSWVYNNVSIEYIFKEF